MGSYHRRLMMATPPLPSKAEIDRIVIERKALGMAVFDSSNAPTGIVRSPGPSEAAREPSDMVGFAIAAATGIPVNFTMGTAAGLAVHSINEATSNSTPSSDGGSSYSSDGASSSSGGSE